MTTEYVKTVDIRRVHLAQSEHTNGCSCGLLHIPSRTVRHRGFVPYRDPTTRLSEPEELLRASCEPTAIPSKRKLQQRQLQAQAQRVSEFHYSSIEY